MEKILYHGTHEKNVFSILRYSFNASKGEKHYLGNGVYFYDNAWKAYNWAEKKFDVGWRVIEVRIKTDDKYVLDMTSKSGQNTFKKFISELSETKGTLYYEYQNNEGLNNKTDRMIALRWALCNMIVVENNYKLIIAFVDIETKNIEHLVLRSLHITTKAEKQYNVVDQSIIIGKKLHSLETIV